MNKTKNYLRQYELKLKLDITNSKKMSFKTQTDKPK